MIRSYQHGVFITPRAQHGASIFLILLLLNALAFVEFAVASLAIGNWVEALVGAALVILSFRVGLLVYSRRGDSREPAVWVADSNDSQTLPPMPRFGSEVRLNASQIARIRLYYREHPSESRSGWLEAVIELRQSKRSYPILKSNPIRMVAALRSIDNVARRWCTTVDYDKASLASAKRVLGPGAGKFMMALAICPLIFGAWTAYRQWRMLAWPHVQATIDVFEPGVGGGSGMHWYANPHIEYRYAVDGVPFDGTRMNPSPWNYQRQSQFEADTSLMKKGAVVRCWYNPSRPEAAYVVNSGVTMDSIVIPTTGAVCLGLSVIYMRMASSSRRLLEERFTQRKRQATSLPS